MLLNAENHQTFQLQELLKEMKKKDLNHSSVNFLNFLY